MYAQIARQNGIAKTQAETSWINRQKMYYRQDHLTEAITKKLERLPGWTWIRQLITFPLQANSRARRATRAPKKLGGADSGAFTALTDCQK